MTRDFSSIKSVVIKIGTNILTRDDGIDFEFIENIAGQIAVVKKQGIRVLLVSSGAIGIGSRELGIKRRTKKIRLRQALAAVGQPILLHRYRLAFQQYGIPISQLLITRDVFNNRTTNVNLKNSVEQLLELGVLPIFNENDCISTMEIGHVFGDNDQLSAYIASNTDVDLLLILSDIDSLYDRDPSVHPDAEPIPLVEVLTEEIINGAGDSGSTFSSGGMKSKLKAVSIAQKAGCGTVLAHGRLERIIPRIINGEEIGTYFLPGEKIPNKQRWILNSAPNGMLVVDDGAERALEQRKSLLPSGVRSVEGEFSAGDVVLINDRFKAVAGLSSTDTRRIIGHHSKDIRKILGRDKRDLVRTDDIVEMDNELNGEIETP